MQLMSANEYQTARHFFAMAKIWYSRPLLSKHLYEKLGALLEVKKLPVWVNHKAFQINIQVRSVCEQQVAGTSNNQGV